MWHHVTPAAVWVLGQAEVYCVSRDWAPPCTRPDYPAVSRLLFRRSGRTTPAFSHCEVVWEKHSSLDPGENSIRTSQTQACVLVQTVITGLAAMSLLRHARLAVIIWQFKGCKELNEWKKKTVQLLTILVFLFLFVFFLYLIYDESLGCAVNKKPYPIKGFPAVMSYWEQVLESTLSPFNLLFPKSGK